MKDHESSLRIYISGLYSGPNPSPGIGIARSLRVAYPNATLIGVDYSNRSSGLHWLDFDEIWLQRPWNELDLSEYITQIKRILDNHSLWISGLDLETIWLAREMNGHPNLLVPPSHTLTQVRKPAIPAHKGLPIRIPPFMFTSAAQHEQYTFCRKHGWPIWVKGPWYQARLARSWHEVKAARMKISKTWSTSTSFLQEHIIGQEESIAFSAFEGELIDCVYMEKRDITPEGKTWAGHISQVPSYFLEPLRRIIKRIRWTGGGELEMVRDIEGNLWLIEWNPRFPAWIYGSTLSGHNLPALLVERTTGIPVFNSVSPQTMEFTRVVIEIPTRSDYPLPYLPEPQARQSTWGFKHPSGMPLLARQLRGITEISVETDRSAKSKKNIDQNRENDILWNIILSDISHMKLQELSTPNWLFFKSVAHFLFKNMADLMRQTDTPVIKIAYSVKTNPDARLLDIAHNYDLLAETISQMEINKALSRGFGPGQIVLNGPGKWWPSNKMGPANSLHALFCDSIEEFRNVLNIINRGHSLARVVGVRIRPPKIRSRFGIQVASPDIFQELVQLVKRLPSKYQFGIHFHIPSSEVGIQIWWELLDSIIHWSKAIEISSKRDVQVLDIGGGFFPDDLQVEIHSKISILKERSKQSLPNLEEIILEPGKALTQLSMGLATRVLEVRHPLPNTTDIVVDGSIAELPDIWHYPHRTMWLRTTKQWKILEREGTSRILGRLCMESDILAENIEIPTEIKKGDMLIFLDAGSYDRSMSYAFGRG